MIKGDRDGGGIKNLLAFWGKICYDAPRSSGHGGIGRHASLRCLWRDPWKFESSWSHHFLFFILTFLFISSKVDIGCIKLHPKGPEKGAG